MIYMIASGSGVLTGNGYWTDKGLANICCRVLNERYAEPSQRAFKVAKIKPGWPNNRQHEWTGSEAKRPKLATVK